MYKVRLNSEIMRSEKRGCKGKTAKAEAQNDSKICRNVGKFIKLLKSKDGDGPESPAQYRVITDTITLDAFNQRGCAQFFLALLRVLIRHQC